MDQRRFLIALVLSFLLLFAYEQLIVRPYRTAPHAGAAGRAEAGTAPPAPGAAVPPAPRLRPRRQRRRGLRLRPGDHPTVTVETDVVRATITTLGARLETLELKDFRQTVAPDSPPLDLVTAARCCR